MPVPSSPYKNMEKKVIILLYYTLYIQVVLYILSSPVKIPYETRPASIVLHLLTKDNTVNLYCCQHIPCSEVSLYLF